MEDSLDLNGASSIPTDDEQLSFDGEVVMESTGMKRSHPDGENRSQNGDTKRQALSAPLMFRLLCPVARIGSVIGKGGETIQQLRQETSARIKVEEAVGNCEERVINISSPDKQGAQWAPAQEAFFRINDRIVEGDSDGTDMNNNHLTVRLLVDLSQTGCLLGKAGSIVSVMRTETGAQIKIAGKHDLPLCALPTEELVQVSGEPHRVRLAIERILAQLRANPAKPQPQNGRSIAVSASAAFAPLMHGSSMMGGGMTLGPIGMGMGGMGRDAERMGMGGMGMGEVPMRGGFHPRDPPMQAHAATAEVSFRLQVPAARVGSVIGRGGDVIRRIRTSTQARIKVSEGRQGGVSEDEREIAISSLDDPGASTSSAQEALLSVTACLLNNDATGPAVHSVRLLVPAGQVGAVLGRGGRTIAQLRLESQAQIRVTSPPGGSGPGGGGPDGGNAADSVILVEGGHVQCMNAVRVISILLRNFQLRKGGGPRLGGLGGRSDSPAHSHSYDRLPGSPSETGYGSNDRRSYPPPPHMHHHHERGDTRSRRGDEASSTLRLQLRSDQVGAVIGRGGVNINTIRDNTGARLKLHNRRDGGERELQIDGTPSQATAARTLVEAFLKAAGAPPLGC